MQVPLSWLKSQLLPWSQNISCECWRTLPHHMKLFPESAPGLCAALTLNNSSSSAGVPKCFQWILESSGQNWVDVQGSCVHQPEALGPLRALCTAGLNAKRAAVVQWTEQTDLGHSNHQNFVLPKCCLRHCCCPNPSWPPLPYWKQI